MCIVFVFTDPNPSRTGYRLIVAANRDEYYKRPSQPIHRDGDLVGGRDMEKGKCGGMWLGASLKNTKQAKFRLGALLNITGEAIKSGAKGRGCVVTDYLTSESSSSDYARELSQSADSYNGFNFVTVEIKDDGHVTTHHYSNIPDSYTSYEGFQVLGFGNTPARSSLTKVKVGSGRFKKIVEEFSDISQKNHLLEKLLELLRCDEKYLPDEELKTRQPLAYEYLSCIFVKIIKAGYGTRTHSIILVDYDWNVEFLEVTMDEPIDPNSPIWKSNTVKARL